MLSYDKGTRAPGCQLSSVEVLRLFHKPGVDETNSLKRGLFWNDERNLSFSGTRGINVVAGLVTHLINLSVRVVE